MGKKVISFSVWGSNPIYTMGATVNIQEARECYPGWECRFYVPEGHPVIRDIEREGGVVIPMPDEPYFRPIYWRFYAAGDPDVDYCIIRDSDSRVSFKEAGAIHEWIRSGKRFHMIKDCDTHRNEVILGGLWGMRGGVVPNMRELVQEWFKTNEMAPKFSDQRFLEAKIWPLVKHDFMCHGKSSITGPGVPFPPHPKLKYGEYIGQVIPPWND